MKRCKSRNCPLPQPLKPSQFNKLASSPDGLQPICKVCQSLANARYRQKSPERARMKLRRSKLKNPQRCNALVRLRRAVKLRQITRQPCQVCGAERVEAYLLPPYERYKAPWDKVPEIEWFCHGHHPRRASASNVILYEEFDGEE